MNDPLFFYWAFVLQFFIMLMMAHRIPTVEKWHPAQYLLAFFPPELWCAVCWGKNKNGRHFTDYIYKCIFLNENNHIFIQISMWLFPIENWEAKVSIGSENDSSPFSPKPLTEPISVFQLTKKLKRYLMVAGDLVMEGAMALTARIIT